MKLFSRILTVIEVVYLTAIVILLAGGMPFGITPYVVASGSMEPAYPTGSLVYVQKTDPSALGVGDVICFQHSSDLPVVTHRIYGIDPATGSFITKGDANESVDAALTEPSQVLGRAVFDIPVLGMVLARYKGVLVAVGLALVGAGLLLSCLGREKEPEESGEK